MSFLRNLRTYPARAAFVAACMSIALAPLAASAQVTVRQNNGPVMVVPNFGAMLFQSNCNLVGSGPLTSVMRIVNVGSTTIPAGFKVGWEVPPSLAMEIVAHNLGATPYRQTGIYTFGSPLAPGGSVVAANQFDPVRVDEAFCLMHIAPQ
jgi:hypothetical protein